MSWRRRPRPTLSDGLTPEQYTATVELFSRATRMHCYSDAEVVIAQVTALIVAGHNASRIYRWLNLLHRAVNVDEVAVPVEPRVVGDQLSLVSPVDDLPETMRTAMRPAPKGQSRVRSVPWLLDPSKAPASVKRRGRAESGVCADPGCGAVFAMNPLGRPATKCPDHRFGAKRKAAS